MTKVTRAISLKYRKKEGVRSGLVFLNLRYIPEDNKLDYLGAEFSDSDTKASVLNTSILSDIYSQMVDELVNGNQSRKEVVIRR